MPSIKPPTPPEAAILPRIPAAKNRLGNWLIYYTLMKPALHAHFARVWVQHCGPLPQPGAGALLIYLNHSAWWDLYLTALIDYEILGRRFDSYGMMEEQQLRRYRFFTWMGAFSVHRSDRHEASRSLRYISHVLASRNGRALFLFPQGRILPNDQRPLRVYTGLARIAQQVLAQGQAVQLLPITARYEFRGEQRPELFLRVGPVQRLTPEQPPRVPALTDQVAATLTANLDALREQVVAGDLHQFAVLLRGRRGIDQTFDAVLRWLKRGRW
ncbi:MAG: glycerol acyltransferase [Chloroflexaceae bacterium]|nr:glycerol acyltransferase [Chloroflexaceae bacterium]